MNTKPNDKPRAVALIERKSRDDFEQLKDQFGAARARRFMSIEAGAEKASKRRREDDYQSSDDEFVEL